MSNEITGDKAAPVSLEQLLHERKIAYARWSFGKSWASYRGVEFSLVGGPDEDEIELDGDVFDPLENLFEHIDTNMGGDEEGLPEAFKLAWEEWLESDEAGRVHHGQHRLDAQT